AIAYPFTKGLQSTFAANSFRRAASTAFVYGYSQGLVEEVQSSKNGNPFENKDGLAHLAFYPLARGVASSIGAMPGGERQYVKEWAWENSV
ncbi:hypothetical protein ACQ1Z4_14175, partial [Enterococcus faecalis]|uniref:hypothetical protein n=1 Tax=Enterococcus faecalis TaxID=1351 RepID=UPI003D6C168C